MTLESISSIRTLIFVLAILPILLIGIAQIAPAGSQDPLPRTDPAILQVRVVEGDGAVYPMGARATRGVTVLVTDETGKPVDGASVSFRLPDDGPTGTFASGSRTEIATTHGDGRATVWGMQWNRTSGSFEIRITAIKGQTRAGTVVQQFLTDAPDPSRSAQIGPGRSHKWLWITLAVAGAAGAAVAATALTGKAAASSPPSTELNIGTPTISLGRP
jgi:hypothetical protein